MPALVVWERLIAAGDDLRLVTTMVFILRMVQISMVIYVIYHIMTFDHKPELFVLTGCLEHEDNYWVWYNVALAACFFTLAYGVVGALIEAAMFKISGRGTPTETEARRHLVPLCKCNMVPMLIIRFSGFIFALAGLLLTEKFCSCAYNNLATEFLVTVSMRRDSSACPTDPRAWYISARVLVFTMACDAFFPAITLIVILRQRIHKLYRRIRPPEEKELEDVHRSWRMKCKRCCQCSSLMTCYMCGGSKLTEGSYVDVAIALTEFIDNEGSLDIVPSDIAASLICLVQVQKQKQIDYKNELLKEGGVFAKDRKLATRLWKQMIDINGLRRPMSKNQESMREISGALRNSLSLSRTSMENIGDIEKGLDVPNGGEDPLSTEIVFHRESLAQNSVSCEEEEKEEVEEEEILCKKQSTSTSSIQPTDTELEQLRQMILTGSETMQNIDFVFNRASRMSFEPVVSKVLSAQNPFDCLVLGEGSRYCAVALASYSWMMYMWTNKCKGGCTSLPADSIYGVLSCQPRCRCCHSSDTIVGDDSCGWKQASVLKSLGIEESDLLYANFRNDVGVNPYMLLRDREWKTIVIAIRGTLSFEDLISDVTISPKSLHEIGEQFGFDGEGEFCHSGMLSGAKWIHDDLAKHNILDKAMQSHPDFGLRIIGHSLGAGVAAMLGRMLRQQYPNLFCLCFSPPGCVFSERTAKESRQYVFSYVLHDDIVPRLSYESLVNLRNDLIEMIARIKVPKHKVFDANWTSWNEESILDLPEKLLHNSGEIPSSKFFAEFEAFKARQTERQQELFHVKMTVPGRILRMVRTSAKLDNVPCGCALSCLKCIVCCGIDHKTKKYKIQWTEAEDLSEIYISPSMMSDHFPYNVARALNVAAESYGVADEVADLTERDQLVRILEGAKKEE
ncbi:hypothetical protein ACHAXR_011065 [Thalassiosira sp. AJA248-18]